MPVSSVFGAEDEHQTTHKESVQVPVAFPRIISVKYSKLSAAHRERIRLQVICLRRNEYHGARPQPVLPPSSGEVPDKGVDDTSSSTRSTPGSPGRIATMFSVTIGHIYSGCQDAEGVLPITHFEEVWEDLLYNVDLLSEGDKDENLKRWLVGEGGAKEYSFR